MVQLYLLKLEIIGMLPFPSCFSIDLAFVHCIFCTLHSCLNSRLVSGLKLISVSFPLLDPG